MNFKQKSVFILASFVLFTVFFGGVVQVQAAGVDNNGAPIINSTVSNNGSPNQIVPLQNPLQVNSISGLLESFLEVASYLLVLFGVLMIIWVGFEFILARGNSTRISELKKQLLYVVIGLAVVIGARIIVSVVINTLQATGTLSPGVSNSIQRANSGN